MSNQRKELQAQSEQRNAQANQLRRELDEARRTLRAAESQLKDVQVRLARPDGGFIHHVGTEQYPHARKLSKPEDTDFLKALQHDVMIWGSSGIGTTEYAGFYILPMYCHIIEE